MDGDGVPGNQGDKEALVSLYHTTGRPGWKRQDNWLTDAPLDQWFGVGTDLNGRVSSLNLGGNSSTGTIPAELASLDQVEVLALNDNRLRGEVPTDLGQLLLRLERLPNHAGISPLKSLSLRFSKVRLERLPISGGISPLKALLLRTICVRLERLPSSGGISPLNSLRWRYRRVRLERLPISGGISPLNRGWSKSASLNPASSWPPEEGLNPKGITPNRKPPQAQLKLDTWRIRSETLGHRTRGPRKPTSQGPRGRPKSGRNTNEPEAKLPNGRNTSGNMDGN